MQQPSTSESGRIVRLIKHNLDLAYSEACALRGLFANLPENETTNELKFHLERLAAQLVEISDLTDAFESPVRADLLRSLTEERSRFFAVVAQIPEERLTIPVADEWSVKDIVGHISTYENEAAERLERVARGQESTVDRGGLTGDAFNEREVATRRDWDWNTVATESDETGERLFNALAALSEAQITGGDQPVSTWLPKYIRHYGSHLAAVESAREE